MNFEDEAINLFEEIKGDIKSDVVFCISKIKVALRLAFIEGQAFEVERINKGLLQEKIKRGVK